MSKVNERPEQRNKTGQPAVPARMRAVRLHSAKGPAGLQYEEVPTPSVGPGEVLVRVYAAAITRDELDWPVDRLPAIPSYEFSGTVVLLGGGARGFNIGQEVYALSPFNRDGAAAEYISAPYTCLARKPLNLSAVEAASLPLAALSAWQGLLAHGQLSGKQRVLIHGATGGVGNFAVQIARQKGAYVIGTVSSRNLEAASKLGLDQLIDDTETPFETATGEVDLVFDTVGGGRLQRSVSVVRPGGRLVSVASEPPQDRAAERGITAIYFVVKPNGEQLAEIGALVEDSRIVPSIARVYPLAEARAAFQTSLEHHPAGKIVLQVAKGSSGHQGS